jgi:hypothetical protein
MKRLFAIYAAVAVILFAVHPSVYRTPTIKPARWVYTEQEPIENGDGSIEYSVCVSLGPAEPYIGSWCVSWRVYPAPPPPQTPPSGRRDYS